MSCHCQIRTRRDHCSVETTVSGARCDFILGTELQVAVCSSVEGCRHRFVIGHGDLSEVVSVENSACGQVVKLVSARAVGGLGADCSWFHGVVSGARCDFILGTELQVAVCSSVDDAMVEY